MLLYTIIIGVLVFINPILGAVGAFACIGIHILISSLSNDKNNKDQKKDDVPYTEYDEFDIWQDNQGL